MTTPRWSLTQPPSHPTSRRMRLRKEFEESVTASRFDDEVPGEGHDDPALPSDRTGPAAARPPSRRAMPIRPPSTRTVHIRHPHLPAPSEALTSLAAALARYNWTKFAGMAATCALASFGAWAATIGLARLVWQFSGH